MQARGNAASRAFSIDKAGFRAASNADLAQPARKDNQLSSAESLDALDRALSASPVDLCCIAEEMCAQPQFATMVMRLASSLLVSPEKSATTIEEAVVALGTDRLRALLHIWSRYRQRRIADSVPSQSGSMAPAYRPLCRPACLTTSCLSPRKGKRRRSHCSWRHSYAISAPTPARLRLPLSPRGFLHPRARRVSSPNYRTFSVTAFLRLPESARSPLNPLTVKQSPEKRCAVQMGRNANETNMCTDRGRFRGDAENRGTKPAAGGHRFEGSDRSGQRCRGARGHPTRRHGSDLERHQHARDGRARVFAEPANFR